VPDRYRELCTFRTGGGANGWRSTAGRHTVAAVIPDTLGAMSGSIVANAYTRCRGFEGFTADSMYTYQSEHPIPPDACRLRYIAPIMMLEQFIPYRLLRLAQTYVTGSPTLAATGLVAKEPPAYLPYVGLINDLRTVSVGALVALAGGLGNGQTVSAAEVLHRIRSVDMIQAAYLLVHLQSGLDRLTQTFPRLVVGALVYTLLYLFVDAYAGAEHPLVDYGLFNTFAASFNTVTAEWLGPSPVAVAIVGLVRASRQPDKVSRGWRRRIQATKTTIAGANRVEGCRLAF